MSFLSPWALLWLAGIPVLVWLWRLATVRHRTLVPSLVPFEHLLRRAPTRRTRLLVNLLFWLQLAALVFIALTLAQPLLPGRHARTTLVVLDTSASMGASLRGPSAFERAAKFLSTWLGRQGPGDRVLVIRSAPITALTQEPVAESSSIRRALRGVAPADLAGNLSLARRIGQSLLGTQPDRVLVLTDEPQPEEPDPAVEFHSFGEPMPNAAIVGLDAYEPLCAATTPQVVVGVQNFADVAQQVSLSVRHDGRTVTQVSQSLPPQGRAPISMSLPEDSAGFFEIELSAPHDALAVDNHAVIALRGAQPIPVVVASAREPFRDTIGHWLDACPRVSWKPMPLEAAPPQAASAASRAEEVLITDDENLAARWPSPAILFGRQQKGRRAIRTQWLADPAHPIAHYLDSLEPVVAALTPAPAQGGWGDPVIWALVDGRKTPIVRSTSVHGRRTAGLFFDPTATPGSVPEVLVFLNTLRWLTGSMGLITTGEPLVVGPFEPAAVRIQPPRGAEESRMPEGGWLRDDATDRAGRYRFIQGQRSIERAVNFLDPIESNTLARASTWGKGPVAEASLSGTRSRQPVVGWLLWLLLAVLLLEWVLYSRRGGASPRLLAGSHHRTPHDTGQQSVQSLEAAAATGWGRGQ